METLESALSLLLSHTKPIGRVEEVTLLDALGRVAAKDILSPMNVPPFDRSPLDGYAQRSADIAGASRENPRTLRVVGEVCAGSGEVFFPGAGEAVRVMTGAQIPDGCDCVIRQEDTDEGTEQVQIYAELSHRQNICFCGEDVQAGSLIVRAGERLTSAHIGVLASLGVTRVSVYGRVRAALLCTGDELVQPGSPLTRGKIYDSNHAALCARLAEMGVEVRALESERDEPEHVAGALCQAAKDADILLTTGGVSVGKKDIFHQVLPLMGAKRLFWKVALKPGSPLLCALYGYKLVICLSGNPFAALCCFELFAKPVIACLAGDRGAVNPRVHAKLSGGFPKKSPGRRLIRAFFDGERVRLTGENHSSGSLFTMIGCNCLIDIPAGSGALSDGDDVEILLL